MKIEWLRLTENRCVSQGLVLLGTYQADTLVIGEKKKLRENWVGCSDSMIGNHLFSWDWAWEAKAASLKSTKAQFLILQRKRKAQRGALNKQLL